MGHHPPSRPNLAGRGALLLGFSTGLPGLARVPEGQRADRRKSACASGYQTRPGSIRPQRHRAAGQGKKSLLQCHPGQAGKVSRRLARV